jgi:release factor glutamine methyltransferase
VIPETDLPVETRRQIEASISGRLGSRREARWIVEEVLGASGSGGDPVVETEHVRIDALASRRGDGEPLQYVLGHWPFRTLDLVLDPRVLIARPETEQLVDVALRELASLGNDASRDTVVVDLGTGSGAIGLAMASEAIGTTAGLAVWCCDASAEALRVTAENLAALGRRDAAAATAVTLAAGDWWDALPTSLAGRVQLVASNPPYVSEGEWADLDASVRCFEPREALVAAGGRDGTPGLAAIEAVLDGAPGWLARPGVAVVELAPHQASAARELALASGASSVRVERDLAGRDRVLVAGWR